MLPLPALTDRDGRVVLAWGPNDLRIAMSHGTRLPFDTVVLTSDGDQDMGHLLEAHGYNVLRCPYNDSPHLDQAQLAVNRCAPAAAALIRADKRVLVLCFLGENRSALMTARIRYLVTGETGASIVSSMKSIPRSEGHTFSNNVFRRWAESWPPQNTKTNFLPFILGAAAVITTIGLVIAAASIKPAIPNRRRRRR